MKFSPRFILLGTLLMVLTFGLNSMVYAQMPEAETAKPDDKVDVDTLIGHMDNEISGYKDQQMDVEMIIFGDRGETKSYRLLIQQMGMDKRLVKFLSGENKGMRILMDGDNKAYVYIPAFKRVRRISNSDMNQTVAGSDFTNNDMASSLYGPICDLTYIRQDDVAWYVRCDPKKGVERDWHHIVLAVEKDGYFLKGIEYYNAKDELTKHMTSHNLKLWEGGYRRYTLIVMKNMLTGHKTELKINDFKGNSGLKPSLFKKRNLQWGK